MNVQIMPPSKNGGPALAKPVDSKESPMTIWFSSQKAMRKLRNMKRMQGTCWKAYQSSIGWNAIEFIN